MASAPDVSKMSFTDAQKHKADLIRQLERAEEAIAEKRNEELKVLADGYMKKCEAAGFSIEEATEALKPYWPTKRGRAARGSGVKKGDKVMPERGATYRLPDGNTYTRPESGKGRVPQALEEAANAAGGYDKLLVKK